jgi:hypothetical protein
MLNGSGLHAIQYHFPRARAIVGSGRRPMSAGGSSMARSIDVDPMPVSEPARLKDAGAAFATDSSTGTSGGAVPRSPELRDCRPRG